MAFSAERFIDEIKPLFIMMGWGWKEERMVLIYEQFMMGYEFADLQGAIKRMEQEEFFKYGKFRNAMDMVRAERMEQESYDEQRREDNEIIRLLNKQVKTVCRNGGNCGGCPVKYCDLIASDSMRAIMAVYDGTVSVDEANATLAKRYRGIGFEREETG